MAARPLLALAAWSSASHALLLLQGAPGLNTGNIAPATNGTSTGNLTAIGANTANASAAVPEHSQLHGEGHTPAAAQLVVDNVSIIGSKTSVSIAAPKPSADHGANPADARTQGNISNRTSTPTNASASTFPMPINATLAAARTGQNATNCGENSIEVGSDLCQPVKLESVMVEYLCKCGKANLVCKHPVDGPFVGSAEIRVRIRGSSTTQTFTEPSTKRGLCEAIKYIHYFVSGEENCDNWVSASDMKDMCEEHGVNMSE